MAVIRKLTESGIARFTEYLKRLAGGESADAPSHLLTGPESSEALPITAEVELVTLETKLAAAKYLQQQLASRMQVVSNHSLVEVVDRLYYDSAPNGTGRPKRGALTRTRPGNLRRLVAVIQQFDLTYDLYAMSPDEILDLLPDEFTRWAE